MAIGGAPAQNRFAAEMAVARPGRVFAAAGYDRYLAGEPAPLAELREWLAQPEVVAVGEAGLDYHYDPETRSAQRDLFDCMLALGREFRKPVIIHTREADADTLALVREHVAAWPADAGCPAVLHCFTGSRELAAQLLDLGLMISFSGIITFRNADPLRAVVRFVPLDRMLVETDAPFLAPVPHRGQRNEPAWVARVAEKIAELKGIGPDEVAAVTGRNAARVFKLNKEGML